MKRPTTIQEATRPRRRPGDPITLGRTVAPNRVPLCDLRSDSLGLAARHQAELEAALALVPEIVQDAYWSEAGEREWQEHQHRVHARHARILQAKVRRLEREAAEAGRAGELRAAQRIVEAEMDGAETYAEVARGERCVGCGVKEGERHSADCRRWWARQHAEEMLKPSPFIQQVLAKKEHVAELELARRNHEIKAAGTLPQINIEENCSLPDNVLFVVSGELKNTWKPALGDRVRIRDCPEAHEHCFHRVVGAVGEVSRLAADTKHNLFLVDMVNGGTASVPASALEPWRPKKCELVGVLPPSVHQGKVLEVASSDDLGFRLRDPGGGRPFYELHEIEPVPQPEPRTPFCWDDLRAEIEKWGGGPNGGLPKAICISDRAMEDLFGLDISGQGLMHASGRGPLRRMRGGEPVTLMGIPAYLVGQKRPACAGFGEVLFFDVEDDLPF